jgi:hypothetical protein
MFLKAQNYAHLLPLLELLVALGLTIPLSRPFNWKSVSSRMPVFLESASVLFVFGLADLLSAHFPLTRELSRRPIFDWVVVALWLCSIGTGMPWAIVNLARGRALTLNIIAILLFAGWLCVLFFGLMGSFIWYL